MAKRINESFKDEEHADLKAKKDAMSKSHGEKLTWRDYILNIAGVNKR